MALTQYVFLHDKRVTQVMDWGIKFTNMFAIEPTNVTATITEIGKVVDYKIVKGASGELIFSSVSVDVPNKIVKFLISGGLHNQEYVFEIKLVNDDNSVSAFIPCKIKVYDETI